MRSFSLTPTTSRRPDIEPVLPLINVVFLLLIFFMVAGKLAPSLPSDITPPDSQVTESISDEPMELVVRPDGSVLWREQPMQLADMPDRLDGIRKDRPVQLLTDGTITIANLRPVLDALRATGVTDVLLVTRRAP
ncbi:MAG: biopolymer transporter ExbD [Gammaproteobacteria bacterium HGW-Gammaproteobacteria-14]|nr:MAG: biopolymer transporter ExbD [Gammaproteobacteria bacterium HGW-Gammaproteobacteria-14]